MRGPSEIERDSNKHWIGEVQPVGVVVTASALAGQALVPAQQTKVDTEAALAQLHDRDHPGPALRDPWAFFSEILNWRASQVAGSPDGPEVPDSLRVTLPASETILEPHLAVAAAVGEGWQLLVRIEAAGVEPDRRGALSGWEATPHQRFERLLRDTGVPTGLLLTDETIRVVYAPKGGESSGWFEVPLRALGTVAGRSMLGGIKLLLERHCLFGDAPERRLPALLEASRRAQAEVSTKLATQVLGALHALLHGLHAAAPTAISDMTRDQPTVVYEGLLAVLMRLVFLLYAEDRGLIPSRDDAMARAFYDQGYGVRTLHTRLLEDAALHPDTMEERRGAWHRLLALFRLVHAGDANGWMRGRGGKLFDPASFPFLQGQTVPTAPIQVPPVSDGCILRVLDGLLTLGGERLSYRALDVEQIGSVYETVMGFTAQLAKGPSLAIRAGKKDRTPVFVDLCSLAAIPSKKRLKWLKEKTERGKFPARTERAVLAARDPDSLAIAFVDVVDERGSPGGRVSSVGTPLLQPTDERRRTGSHYTPRELTAPIVRHALEPAFERIGTEAMPEDVLALKVCDPAMGSGAFLVEACRQLAARLIEAWRLHEDKRPALPPDESEELHARRLVAQRCLYGVDRNHMATDLARLSLWLATLARDHEFSFLDHALRTGDSLVGLTRLRIGAMRWDAEPAQGSLFTSLVRQRVAEAVSGREEIRSAPDDVSRSIQEMRYGAVERRLDDIRLIGDSVVASFFAEAKPAGRESRRAALEDAAMLDNDAAWIAMRRVAADLQEGPHTIRPFHWELEFPEVFGGASPGFDAVVGNPPFAGKNTLLAGNRAGYVDWLQSLHQGAHGNADLVAHFVCRAFSLLRPGGCFGLIATNTVGQGDTRESGLRAVIEGGGSIIRAVRRLPWPGEAAVVVSVVHVLKEAVRRPVLDGQQVRRISAYLVEGDLDATPARLAANAGKAFQGAILLGLGFTFDDSAVAKGKPASSVAEMHKLIEDEPRNAERILPYLGGAEVNTDPCQRHRRWCIDFDDFPLRRVPTSKRWVSMDERERSESRRSGLVPEDYPEAVAADWPTLLEIVERLVRPERATNKDRSRRELWWQHTRRVPALRQASVGLDEVHILSRVSAQFGIATVPTGTVCADSTVVFADQSAALRGVLQSRVHELWAAFFASSLEDRLRYGPSDCFDTFPFPVHFDSSTTIASAGKLYHEHRASVMTQRSQGLTKTYNRFHLRSDQAPDIVRLRELHCELDRAVLAAYGWDDLARDAAPVFLSEDTEAVHRYQKRLFWPAEFRDVVLARLLEVNVERAEDERARGLIPGEAEADIDSDTDADELEEA
jgi:hypothetical protein